MFAEGFEGDEESREWFGINQYRSSVNNSNEDLSVNETEAS